MKTIVITDTHKHINPVIDVIQCDRNINCIVHLGDVEQDAADLKHLFPNCRVIAVCGNNDYFTDLPVCELFELYGKKFFAVHGHLYGVKSTLDRLYCRGAELDADFILFGHTHIKHEEKRNGIIMLNPSPHYGIVFNEDAQYEFVSMGC